jgi:hypothetical protein
MSLIDWKVDKVDCGKKSNQKQRWLATALPDIEPRLNICECRHLSSAAQGDTERAQDRNRERKGGEGRLRGREPMQNVNQERD